MKICIPGFFNFLMQKPVECDTIYTVMCIYVRGEKMGNRNWEDFGEEIRRLVQEAIDRKDFERLSESINRTVDQALASVRKAAADTGEAAKREFHNYKTQASADMSRSRKAVPSVKQQMKAPSRVPSVFGAFFGLAIGVELLGSALMLLFASAAIGGIGALVLCAVAALFAGGIGAALFALGVSSAKKLARIGRFKKYAGIIGENEYCNIAVLAAGVGLQDDTVVKDVEYMIKNRWFKQGHLDRERTCLMLTDRMHQQYLQLELQRAMQQEEKKAAVKQEEKETSGVEKHRENPQQSNGQGGQKPEVQKVIALGKAYLEKIRDCNERIPGEEISAKISRIEVLVDKIFLCIEQNPKKISDIRKMMDYYLPTTVKLLEAYAQMDAQPVGGENIRNAKKEIEETLDTLNAAFEKLLDSLFQETAWDVSSDISVLNTMLAQDGLKDDGLTGRKDKK